MDIRSPYIKWNLQKKKPVFTYLYRITAALVFPFIHSTLRLCKMENNMRKNEIIERINPEIQTDLQPGASTTGSYSFPRNESIRLSDYFEAIQTTGTNQ